MKRIIQCGAAAMVLGAAGVGRAADVDFAQATYTVQPGQAFSVDVRYQPFPSEGLFSGGLRLSFPNGSAAMASTSDIFIPTNFAGDGLGGQPAKQTGPGFVAFSTATNRSDMTYTAVDGLMATFSFTNQAAVGASYTLTLADFDGSAGTTEFVTGEGDPLTPSFGAATVNVVPEPSLAAVAVVAFLPAVLRRRRR